MSFNLFLSALNLRYIVTYARVLDANRKFLDAATRFYEISIVGQNHNVKKDFFLNKLNVYNIFIKCNYIIN